MYILYICFIFFSWQVKLSSKTGQNFDIVWTENSLLITVSGEQVIRSVYTQHLDPHTHSSVTWIVFLPLCFRRLWDLERDDNFVLSLDETLGFERGEMINCVSYCAAKGKCEIFKTRAKCLFLTYLFFFPVLLTHSEILSRLIQIPYRLWNLNTQKASLLLCNIVASTEILAGGTSHGRIAMWRMVAQPGSSKGDTNAQWKLQTPTEIEGNVTQIQVLSGPAFTHQTHISWEDMYMYMYCI